MSHFGTDLSSNKKAVFLGNKSFCGKTFMCPKIDWSLTLSKFQEHGCIHFSIITEQSLFFTTSNKEPNRESSNNNNVVTFGYS